MRILDRETIGNNILISIFYGFEFYPDDPWYKLNGYKEHYFLKTDDEVYRYSETEFKWDMSWDWLILVIKKIKNMSFKKDTLINAKNDLFDNLGELIMSDDIDNTYLEVIKFIKIYNHEENIE